MMMQGMLAKAHKISGQISRSEVPKVVQAGYGSSERNSTCWCIFVALSKLTAAVDDKGNSYTNTLLRAQISRASSVKCLAI